MTEQDGLTSPYGLTPPYGLTNDEVALVRRAAVLAGATVAIARYSGAGGTRVEFHAIMEGLERAIADFPDNPLVRSLISLETRADVNDLAPQFHDAVTQRDYADFEMAALNRCTQAGEVLKAKLPPERATEVRAAIVKMCEHVAQASVEKPLGSADPTGDADDEPVAVREATAVKSVIRALEGG